jgi:hypothetical protein
MEGVLSKAGQQATRQNRLLTRDETITAEKRKARDVALVREFLAGTRLPLKTREGAELALKAFERLFPPAFVCRGCGRPEEDCSAQPCASVLADRKAAAPKGWDVV